MKILIKTLLLVTLFSCSSDRIKSDKSYLTIKSDTKNETFKTEKFKSNDNNSNEFEEHKTIEVKSNDSVNINHLDNDCIFDIKTQTSDFIDSIPEFSNYTWNDEQKTATIALNNGDTLYASRGGCNHFGISGKLKVNKKIDLDSVEIIIEEAKWIAKRIFSHGDYTELNTLIENENYQIDRAKDWLHLNFNHEFYMDYSISVHRQENGTLTIEIGYYII